ncbi:MAG: hypothetical protein MI749_13840, partial [Desulfovibrionales bacterium]|nr:hypothetical protein [Desulfovibrionales bacterium]
DYLKLFSKNYNGSKLHINSPACIDQNLVTASSAGGLLWAKYIIKYLGIYPDEVVEAWYNYFKEGEPRYFQEMMEAIK